MLRTAFQQNPFTNIFLFGVRITLVMVCLLHATFAFGQGILVEEDPDRRKILSILNDLQQLTPENYSRMADSFDAAWALAVRSEDPLLNLSTDREKSLEPGASQLDAGARYRLSQVFMKAPPAFRRIYQEQVRSDAETAFEQALSSANIDQLLAVVQRFQFTEVAGKGLRHLIQLRRSRGEYLQASLQHGRWMSLQQDVTDEQRILQIQLLAQAGLDADALDLFRDLLSKAGDQSIRLLAEINQAFGGRADVSMITIGDGKIDEAFHQLIRGRSDSSGSAVAKLSTQPLGNPRRIQVRETEAAGDLQTAWRQSTFSLLEAESFNAPLDILARRLDGNISAAIDDNQTVIPISTPLLTKDHLIFRTAMNLRAVDRLTGDPAWESFLLDRYLSTALKSPRRLISPQMVYAPPSAERMLSDPISGSFWVLNNTAGQLTSDGRTIYSVEEVMSESLAGRSGVQVPRADVAANYLRAYDQESGRLRAQAGGVVGRSDSSGAVNPLAGMYFLGAPLILGDRIYVIAEAEAGIYLLRLKATPLFGPADEFQLQPVSSQLLSIPRFPLRTHPQRRSAGIVPSYGQGLIICTTCDEHILAVSAEDHSVKWIYRYPTIVAMAELGAREGVISGALLSRDSPQVDLKARWTDGLPRIIDNRIVVTPRDTDQLLCLDLQTGEELWTMARGKFRTIASVDRQKVVLSGPTVIAAVRLSDGQLLWSTDVTDGRVCGTGYSDGQILHLPTSLPGVLSVRLEDGQPLLHLRTETIPGNLLGAGDSVYSQTVSSVSKLQIPKSTNDPLFVARKKLLNGEFESAIRLLKEAFEGTADSETRRAASEEFVDAVLNGLRANQSFADEFADEAAVRLRELQSAEDVLPVIIRQFFGVPPIAADFRRLSDITRADRKWSSLSQVLTKRSLENTEEDPETVARRMGELLQEAWRNRNEAVQQSDRVMSRGRLVVQQLRIAIAARQGETRLRLNAELDKQLRSSLRQSESNDETRWWLSVCLLLDLPGPAADSILARQGEEADSDALANIVMRRWVQQQSSPDAVDRYLDYLTASGQESRLSDLMAMTTEVRQWDDPQIAIEDLLTSGWFSSQLFPDDELQKRLSKYGKSKSGDVWAGKPKVKASDAHSVSSPGSIDMLGAVKEDLPLFDSMNEYRHWNFLVETTSELGPLDQVLRAYDESSRLRWTLPLDRSVRNRFGFSTSPTLDRYLVAYGSWMLLYRDSRVTMLDCSTASSSGVPKVLWSRALVANPSPTSWERTTVYDREPTGLKPVGPVSEFGVPLISGATMTVVDPTTGKAAWEVTGLAPDCSVTVRGDRIVLMSQSTSELETRSMIDGSLISIQAIPDWWRDAEENSTSSPRYYELDNSDSIPVRLQIFDGQCVIYRYGLSGVTVESHDLVSGKTRWTRSYPGESAVSNVRGGVVAVLSGGTSLQLLDIATGATRPEVAVSESKETLYLYLRRSAGHWLVVTDDFDPVHDDQNPTSQSVIVNGHVHALRVRDGELAWSQPIQHEWLRVRRPNSRQPPIPPVAPILVLLKRPSPEVDEFGIRRGPTLYQAKILDVRTGELLYQDKDVGYTLSNYFLKLQQPTNSLLLNFDKRSVTFDYSKPNGSSAESEASSSDQD